MRSRFSSLLCFAAALLVLLTLSPVSFAQTGDELWTDVNDDGLRITAKRTIVPKSYRALSLDKGAMSVALSAAPLENRADAIGNELVLSLPLPDGGFGRFLVKESPIMAPGLAKKFPEIRTYSGQGIDDPAAIARLDQTPAGFHAMVLSPAGTFYIDPYGQDDNDHYISYLKANAQYTGQGFECAVHNHDSLTVPHKDALHQDHPRNARFDKVVSGSTLRTYRLAVAATGEYTAFHGGTVAQAQAAIVTAMNRVNGIYERDVAIRMVLIANNDQLVYTNSGSDPYSNGNGVTMLGQNQSNVDSVIGSGNYDIGHVFSTGGGGVASLRVPCVNGSKARGVTGQSSPTGDPFWVDYVAHEMGHQWGGNHTFNGSSGNCAGGNRNGSTAYEPGSGTTIQAYAGICAPQNIQPNSDDHFHGISLDEIVSYSTTGNGDNCPVRTATGNDPPTVNAGANYTIPLNTPFELCGSATDPQGSSSLTYNWEEFDLGPTGAPNSPSGNAAIFRSFSPRPSPCRTFPQLSDLVNNTQTLGEILPSYARTMNFRLTARDNTAAGGGVADDAITVTASSAGNNFQVTAPNTAVNWTGNSSQTVSWNVAGTDLSPISCSAVDISLSSDGGTTYPTTLATGVSNSGSASVTVPNSATSSARVKVQCSGNVFFDISNANFTITASSGNPPTVNITAPANGSSSEVGTSVSFSGTATDPEDGNLTANLSWTSSIDGNIGSGGSFSTTALSLGSHTITASVTDSGSLSGSDAISITVTPVGGGNGPQDAAFNGTYQAPACLVAGSSCDTNGLVDGRGTNGPEPNQPNTIADACADGTAGTYHSDESNDRIVVTTLDGTDMVEGATVRIDATVWAWTTPAQDTLDLYYAADATNPSWTLITSIVPSSAGEQTLSAQYTLPTGTLQAVRAQFRYQSTNASCAAGTYNDRDDVVFAVNPAAGCTTNAECDNGLFCDGTETCNVGTGVCESGTAVACGDGVSCTTDSCNEATDSCDNTPSNAACDNGLFCDGSETCDAVNDCQAGTAPNCNDGISCTVDSCNEGSDSCNNAPDDGACDNGQFCDGSETCNAATGCEAGSTPCSGGQTCNETTDLCEGGSGCTDCVDWNTTGTVSYSNQDLSPNVTVESSDSILLTDNTWRRTTQTFNVTANTVIEFDFQSTSEGEIHGIGFDEDDTLTNNTRIFQLHGTQNWGSAFHDFDNYSGTGVTSYTIPVGQFYTGSAMFLVLVNDNDAGSGNTSRFQNVRVYEDVPVGCTTTEDFESGSAGWTTSGTCSTGTFVLGAPTQQTSTVVTQVGGDHTGGGDALFTATNSSAGNADVDGGECVVTSPVFNVTDASDLAIWYFHGQRDAGDDATGDYFELATSVNGGAYSPFVSIGDVRNVAAWTNATTTVPAGASVQLRVRVSDGSGPGDIIEGGIDDLSICPQ